MTPGNDAEILWTSIELFQGNRAGRAITDNRVAFLFTQLFWYPIAGIL